MSQTESESRAKSLIWIVTVIIFIAAMAGMTFYFRKRSKKDFLTGFRKDEKRAIIYLEQKKDVFQSSFQHELGFSRAKSTRIVKKLEEKGLLRKEEYGRTNKLHWLK